MRKVRKLLSQYQKVRIKKTGEIGQVEYDYEDLIYVYGINKPFRLDQIEVL